MTRTNNTRSVAVGTVKKSIDAHCDRCVRRNVRQVGEGDGARRPRYLPIGRLGDLNAQLLEFAVDARGAPGRIGAMHLLNQRADVAADRRTTETGLRGSPAPMPREETTMPTNDGGGLYDLDGIRPA